MQVDAHAGVGDLDEVVAVDPQAQVHPLAQRIPQGEVIERVDVEVRPDLAVEHVQHVAGELGGDPVRVVVGGDETVDRLHQVDAEQQPARLGQLLGEHRQERPALLDVQVADGRAEEGDQGHAVGRQVRQVQREVADEAVHLHAGVGRALSCAAASRKVDSLTSKGTNRRS